MASRLAIAIVTIVIVALSVALSTLFHPSPKVVTTTVTITRTAIKTVTQTYVKVLTVTSRSITTVTKTAWRTKVITSISRATVTITETRSTIKEVTKVVTITRTSTVTSLRPLLATTTLREVIEIPVTIGMAKSELGYPKHVVELVNEFLYRVPPRKVRIYLISSYLIAIGKGLVSEVGFFDESTMKPVHYFACSVSAIPTQSLSPADIVIASRNFMACAISMDRIVEKVGCGRYLLAVFSGNKVVLEVETTISDQGIGISYSSSHELRELAPLNPSKLVNLDPLLAAILRGVDRDSVEEVSRKLGLAKCGSLSECAWRAIDAISKAVSYEFRKGNYVQTPLETLERGKGICSDFALLTLAAMLSIGFERGFVAEIELVNASPHAVELEEIGNSLLLFDQSPPPIEWQDYVQYVLRGEKSIASLELYAVQLDRGGQPKVVSWRARSLDVPDSWPSDSLPKGFSYRVSEEVAKEIRAMMCPELRSLRCLVGTTLEIKGPTLRNFKSTNYALSKLYSPIFDKEWIELYAKLALRALRNASRAKCLWIDIEQHKGFDELWTYSTPFKVPTIAISMAKGNIEVLIEGSFSVKELGIAIYIANSTNPYLWIVPPGYTCSPSTKCVNANEWLSTKSYTLISVKWRKLATAGVKPINTLVILVKGVPTYAVELSKVLKAQAISSS